MSRAGRSGEIIDLPLLTGRGVLDRPVVRLREMMGRQRVGQTVQLGMPREVDVPTRDAGLTDARAGSTFRALKLR